MRYDGNATRNTFEAAAKRLLTNERSPHSDQLQRITCIERTARDEWRGMPECMNGVYVCPTGLTEWRRPSAGADTMTPGQYWESFEWTECGGCGWHAPQIDEYGCDVFSQHTGRSGEDFTLCEACDESCSRVACARRGEAHPNGGNPLFNSTPTELDHLVWGIVLRRFGGAA